MRRRWAMSTEMTSKEPLYLRAVRGGFLAGVLEFGGRGGHALRGRQRLRNGGLRGGSRHAAIDFVLQALHAFFELNDALAEILAHFRELSAKQQNANNADTDQFRGAEAEKERER